MDRTLGEHIERLDRLGELVRVGVPVSSVLEVSAISDRLSKSRAPSLGSPGTRWTDPARCDRGGPAVLLERVVVGGAERSVPVLINGWGSYRRIELALGCGRDESGVGWCSGGLEGLAERIGAMVRPQPPRSVQEAIERAKLLRPMLSIGPKRRRRGACQEVVVLGERVDMTVWPMIRCWPSDGDFAGLGYPGDVNDAIAGLGRGGEWERWHRGRYITLAGIHTVHASDAGSARPASHNIGMYRVQLLGPRRMAMHWHMHHDGAAHWRSWKRLGRPMPVAIVLGGEPCLPYAATCPLPPGMSELLMAGLLHGGGIELVPARTVPLRVPANAEIVIEGYVSHESAGIGWEPGAEALGPGAVFEGPFGDHTGFYSMPDRYPIMEVTAVTHRRDPVYPTTVVGLPTQEDYFLGKATERVFLPLLRVLIPDIEDYDLPMFGAFHNCVMVRIAKHYPMHARRVMHAIWGAGQMAWTKCVFVVEGDVDVHDAHAVLASAARRCLPVRDVELVRGPVDILDHAAACVGVAHKMGFDCTQRWPEERPGPWPAENARAMADVGAWLGPAMEVAGRAQGVAGVAVPPSLGGWCLVRASGGGRSAARALCGAWSAAHTPPPPWTIVLDADADSDDIDACLFDWLANCEMQRDRIDGRTADGGSFSIFDATAKRPGAIDGWPVRRWPPKLRFDERTRAMVEGRWEEYGLGGYELDRRW